MQTSVRPHGSLRGFKREQEMMSIISFIFEGKHYRNKFTNSLEGKDERSEVGRSLRKPLE